MSKRILSTVLLLTLTCCLAEDPASFRSVDALLTGRWNFVGPEATIDLNPDGTFDTSSGLPGVAVRTYHGRFWQTEGVLAFRGTGVQGGQHVQFVSYAIVETPATTLTLTDIFDDYAAGIIGVEDLNALSNKEVQRALRRFDRLTFPDEAGYRANLYTNLSVLDAEQDLYSAKRDLTGARYEYVLNSLRLKAIVGELSESDLVDLNQWLTL